LRELTLLASNYFIFVIITTALASVQSSLWLQVFGYFPAPYLWLTVLNYWVMFRRPVKAVIMTYFVVYVLIAMTGMPLNMIFAVLITNFFIINFLKDRVLWSGPTHFMLACGTSALLLPVNILAFSMMLEANPIADFYFFDWILRSLLTALFSLPFFHIFSLIDKFTQQEAPKDTSSQII
jgi:hypothetical protein